MNIWCMQLILQEHVGYPVEDPLAVYSLVNSTVYVFEVVCPRAAQMCRLEPLAVLSRPLAGAAGGPRELMQPLAVPEAGSYPK